MTWTLVEDILAKFFFNKSPIQIIISIIGGVAITILTYLTLDQIHWFFFPREGAVREKFPFEATYLALTNQHCILEMIMMYIEKMQKEIGRKTIIIYPFGLCPMVITTDVGNVTHILKTNFENYGKGGPQFKPRLQGLLGDGIFNSDGKQWYAHRKTSAHLFKLNKFRSSILSIFNEDLDQVVEVIDKQMEMKQSFDFHDLMHRFTLESISRIAFGVELNCIFDQNVNFAKDFDYCTMQINDSLVNPLWRLERYFTPKGWMYYFCLWRINRYAKGIIQERREMVSKGLVKDKNDLLSLYLDKDSFRDLDKSSDGDDTFIEPNDKNMRDVILNMVIAGRDTTAQALSWAFFRLCIHPDTQKKARDEVIEVLKTCEHEDENGDTMGQSEFEVLLRNSGKGKIGFKAVQQMKFVECVCMETLRLHPSVPKEGKCCFKDEILPDGTPVRTGDLVSFFPWIMGRDTDLWGSDAREFKPERFLENMKPSLFVFTAFQAGPRTCLGQNFAILEMKTVLARLLMKYEFKLGQDESSITYENSLTLPIKGVYNVIFCWFQFHHLVHFFIRWNESCCISAFVVKHTSIIFECFYFV